MSLLRLLFSFYGRVGRLKYFFTTLLFTLFCFIGYTVFLIVLIANSPEQAAEETVDASMMITLILTQFVVIAFVIANFMALTAKRLRDQGFSPLFCLIAAIPFVGIILWLFCSIYKGDFKEEKS